jgi:hypothetical protein
MTEEMNVESFESLEIIGKYYQAIESTNEKNNSKGKAVRIKVIT